MAATIGGFWPPEIKPGIQTPLAILQPRPDELTRQTRGILIGRVSTVSEGELLYHHLDVVVPSLKDFCQRLVTVRHKVKPIYPAYVDADAFKGPPVLPGMAAVEQLGDALRWKKRENEASTDEELVELLKKALHFDPVRSTLVSLIALANQATSENGQPEGGNGQHAAPVPEKPKPDQN